VRTSEWRSLCYCRRRRRRWWWSCCRQCQSVRRGKSSQSAESDTANPCHVSRATASHATATPLPRHAVSCVGRRSSVRPSVRPSACRCVGVSVRRCVRVSVWCRHHRSFAGSSLPDCLTATNERVDEQPIRCHSPPPRSHTLTHSRTHSHYATVTHSLNSQSLSDTEFVSEWVSEWVGVGRQGNAVLVSCWEPANQRRCGFGHRRIDAAPGKHQKAPNIAYLGQALWIASASYLRKTVMSLDLHGRSSIIMWLWLCNLTMFQLLTGACREI